VQGLADLAQAVAGRRPGGRFPDFSMGWQKQANEHGYHTDYDKQFH
jgi:hypothetical protein